MISLADSEAAASRVGAGEQKLRNTPSILPISHHSHFDPVIITGLKDFSLTFLLFLLVVVRRE